MHCPIAPQRDDGERDEDEDALWLDIVKSRMRQIGRKYSGVILEMKLLKTLKMLVFDDVDASLNDVVQEITTIIQYNSEPEL